jgi:hypothetical protein
MCFRPNSATAPRRRSPRCRPAPALPPLAMLDLSQPGERQAHDFLLRATSASDKMWELLDMRRLGDVLLCVVRWVHPETTTKPFSLAEVGLTESAVHWRTFASAQAAQAEMVRRCVAPMNGADSDNVT